MNRDVLRRQMFAKGGVAYPMQNGGMAPAPLPADPGPMPAPAPMPPMDPGNADMGQVAQAAMQNGVDPAMLETMLTQYASGLDDLENAQDYETVMNGIRGDQQPIQQRYQELANVVGPEDAQQTPESVLTLVQPVMMMASVDQGIGSLAAEQMAAPVQGPMAEGIMSTVDMPAPGPEPMAAPAPMAGGPDPVNFNQGGEVQYFADGGVALPQSPLSKAYQDKLPLYQQILGVEDREKAFQDQKNMTQAQMLFDIAQGALMFATPGERNMSPAERLAQSFTPVLGNISSRAGELQKFKQSQAEQDRALKLQALGSAEKTLAARRAAEVQEKIAADRIASQEKIAADSAKPGDTFVLKDAEGKVLYQGPIGTVGQQNALLKKYPNTVTITEVAAPKSTAKIQVVINKNDPKDIQSFDLSDPAQRKKYNALDRKIYIPTSMPSMKDLKEGVSLGNGAQAKFIELTSKPEVLEQYANGTLDAFSTNTINAFITKETVQKPAIDPTSGRAILVPGFKLSPAMVEAIQQRAQVEGIKPSDLPLLNGKDVLDVETAKLDKDPNTTGRIKFLPDGTVDFSTFANDQTLIMTGQYDLTKSQTFRSGVNRFFNFLAGQLGLSSGYAGEEGRITSNADKQLESLARRIVTTGRAGVEGKVFAWDVEMLKNEVDQFRPGAAKTDVQARDQLVAVRNSLASMYTQAWKTASDPAADPSGKTIVKANTILNELESLLAETTAAIAIYDKYLSRDPIAESVSDRAATSTAGKPSVTSSLPRASGGN